MEADSRDITEILDDIRQGSEESKKELFGLVYGELRQIARRQMVNERRNHTLQSTALVHEAYVRLIRGKALESLENRAHFFGAATRTMRQLLTDHARQRRARKRSASAHLLIDNVLDELESTHRVDYLDLEDALEDLAGLDQRQCRIVEFRFFIGLSVPETAEQLGVSTSTVEKEFRSARSWLNLRLK